MRSAHSQNSGSGIAHGRGITPPPRAGKLPLGRAIAPTVKSRIAVTGDADQAIRDYLIKLLLEDRPEYGMPYLSFPYGGLPASAENFQFLEDPSKVDQAYDFAQLANSIPNYDTQNRWVFTANQLADQYTHWLDNFIPPPLSITKEEQKQLSDARKYCEKHFSKYWEYRNAFYSADNEYEAWLHMPESERPPDYDKKLSDAQQQMENARQEWEIKGDRSEYETQYAIVANLSRRDPALAKQNLREQMGTPIISRTGEFYWTSLLPSSAFTTDDAWMRYEVEFASENAAAPTMALMARRAFDQPAFTVEEIALDDTRVTFEMVRLAIDRGWFSESLLVSQAWKWSDSTPANPLGGYPLSNGQPQPSGHLVMIPREVLFIRNKQIESPALVRSLRNRMQAAPDAWLSFGPFGLGSSRLGQHSRGADFSLTGSGVEAPQMEYFAFLCELLPAEPNPNWNLWSN